MAASLNLKLVDSATDIIWDLPETAKVTETDDLEIACVGGGMASGKPSLLIRGNMEDGTVVLLRTSLLNLVVATSAFMARFGDPRRQPDPGNPLAVIQQMHEQQHKSMSKEAAVLFVEQFTIAWRMSEPTSGKLSDLAGFILERACPDCVAQVLNAFGQAAEGPPEDLMPKLIGVIKDATPDNWNKPSDAN